ncbi:MAG: aminopeptidase P family protein [Planctomycetes bacterium]|nr:aminopeptidase P family protein [Planctomycetota bacterium]
MTENTLKKHVSAVAKSLKNLSLDAAVITSATNVSYLTGFSGDDSWALIIGRRTFLLTDSRYLEQALKECPACKVVQRTKGLVDEAASIIARSKSVKTVGVEDTTSIAIFDTIRKKIGVKVKKISRLVENIRTIKSPEEIACIRKAGTIADASLDSALKQIATGITESWLAGLIEFEMRKRGANISFDTIVAFGPNASRNHHTPGTRKLKKRDTILIDFGARYKGYCSDKTRCFAVGKPTKIYQDAYNTVADAQAAGIKAVANGVSCAKIDSLARKVIEDAGFTPYEHGLGHGLGMEVHEMPILSKLSKEKLRTGQVITIEPGIYVPGKFGIRIEDDIVVTETGCKILSRTNKSPELKMLL